MDSRLGRLDLLFNVGRLSRNEDHERAPKLRNRVQSMARDESVGPDSRNSHSR
jgi:hypothetical protein